MADTTTTSTPWEVQQPYLRALWDQAGALASTPREYYPGQGYVGFSAPTEMAMGMQMQRALAGSPVLGSLNNYLTGSMGQPQMNLTYAGQGANQALAGMSTGMNALQQTARGQMLGANPYLDQQFNAASDAVTRQFNDSVLPNINATFGAGGRTGSGAHQQAMANAQQGLGNQLGNMAANIYGGAYESERGRQMAAAQQLQQGALGGGGLANELFGSIGQNQFRGASLAPTAQALEYGNIDRLMGVGGMVDEQSRAILQDQMNRYNYYRDTPYDNLNWMMGLVGGQYGGRQVQQGGSSGIGKVLGGAGTGAGIGGAIGTGIVPGVGTAVGAGIGAGLGGILGYFA